MRIKQLLLTICCFTFILCCQAQTMWKYFSADDFAKRRTSIQNKIGNGIAILQAADLTEAYIKFRQDNNFYYLSGVEIPDAMLLINGKTKQSVLFVPDIISRDIKAEAHIVAGDAAAKEYKFDKVLSRKELPDYLANEDFNRDSVFILTTPEETAEMSRDRCTATRKSRANNPWDGRIPKEVMFKKKLEERNPILTIKNLSPFIDSMRWIKDEKEIAVLRECGRIGCLGIDEAIKVTRPGIYEYQTVAACDFIYGDMGTAGPAYFAIAASGAQALNWHYNANNHLMEAGTIILLDYAPEVNYYVTDITRTWPVSGRFSQEQLLFYNCVKDAHIQIIAAMKPGITIDSLKKIGARVYRQHGMEKYWLNYVGHFVGMAVHDVGPEFYSRPLEPGVVFNVEPILEDKIKKMHFRLEDTIVITATGAENLTAQSPINVEDIYKLIKAKGVGEK